MIENPSFIPQNPQRTSSQDCCLCISGTFHLALIIIGISVAAGALSSVVAGGTAIGLSVGVALTSCCGGFEGRKRSQEVLLHTIFAIVISIISVLAIAEIITPNILGWCLIAPTIVHVAVRYCRAFCCY